MSMFNMGGSVQAANIISNNSSNYLKAGIHEVVFKGIEKIDNAEAVMIKFETPDGSKVHNERLFSPRSGERGNSTYGPTPSEFEQFLSKCKCLIKALDPELFERIEKDGSKFSAPDFDSFINLLKKYLDKKVDTVTNIKLIPTKGNFVGFPGYPARLTKDGRLYVANNFIGEGLALTAKEVKDIEAVATAKPTDMSHKAVDDTDDIMDAMAAEYPTPENSDLPEMTNVQNESDDEMPF